VCECFFWYRPTRVVPDQRPLNGRRWGAGVVVCLERGADLHMAQLIPLPLTVTCFSKIQIGFTFLVPADPGSPGKRAVKRVCVCVRACVRAIAYLLRNICTKNYCNRRILLKLSLDVGWYIFFANTM